MTEIEGVNVAAITPRQPGSTKIEMGDLFDLIDYLCESGVHGISLFGSTGEFVHYSPEDRQRVIRLTIKRSRIPTIIGVSHSTIDGAVWLAQEAADAGAAAVMLMPPYFFPYGQEEIREFYLQFAKEVREAVPIFLYNIPDFTSEIRFETASELLSTGLFAGIKDSTLSLTAFLRLQELRQHVPPFTLLVGNDAIFTEARKDGADGLISGVACAVPEMMLALDGAIRAGDDSLRDRMQARLVEFLTWLDPAPSPLMVRVATEMRGLKTGPHAVPAGPALSRHLAAFREWFQGWLPAVQGECRGV